jgi:heme exporter protein C
MKKNWWKILCVLLLSWTFVAGLIVPLRTGVTNVLPLSAKVGDTIWLKVQGYNSQWENPSKATAWLHIDEFFKSDKSAKKADSIVAHSIASLNFKAIDARNIEFQFAIPRFLPSQTKLENASLLVDVGSTEQAIRPASIALVQDSINEQAGKTLWNAKMDIHREWRFAYPYRNLLAETVRNTYYHVPMWFVMFTLFGVGVYQSIVYLWKRKREADLMASSYTQAGVLFGFLGLFSGGLWANYAWGQPFPMDIKIIMTYTALAIYLAYFILRGAFEDDEKRARISAVYSVFAFATLVPLLYVVPRLAESSLHPGNGSNIAFGSQDMDNTMRMVFYPASIGWILLGIWIGSLIYRTEVLKEKVMMKSMN